MITRPIRASLLLALVATLGSCTIEEPFARTNPFDSKSIYSMVMVGPDSVHGIGERFTMTIQSTPALPTGTLYVRWQRSHPLLLAPVANGEFVVINASPTYTQVFITATFDDVVIGRTIWVGQRP